MASQRFYHTQAYIIHALEQLSKGVIMPHTSAEMALWKKNNNSFTPIHIEGRMAAQTCLIT